MIAQDQQLKRTAIPSRYENQVLFFMTIQKDSLEKLRQIHSDETGQLLSDQEVLELGTRLITFLSIIVRPIDINLQKNNNKSYSPK